VYLLMYITGSRSSVETQKTRKQGGGAVDERSKEKEKRMSPVADDGGSTTRRKSCCVRRWKVSVPTSPWSAHFALTDGTSAASSASASSSSAASASRNVGSVGVVVVGIVVVVVVLHHLVAVLFAQETAADECVAVTGHQLSLTFGARETLDVVNTSAGRRAVAVLALHSITHSHH
jgi:hypothetical protein